MNRKNITFGIIGLVATIVGFLSKAVYREYVAMSQINDFGFADSLPSFLYVIGFSQLLLIKPTRHPSITILIITLGSVAYEFWQYSSSGVLDIGDIVASLTGGVISLMILKFIVK